MVQRLATPGVYIEEKQAFGNAVAGIPTAVPAFIGYTEFAQREGKSLILKPTRIRSLTEFHKHFGKGAHTSFSVKKIEGDDFDIKIATNKYVAALSQSHRFTFYDSLRMFFANGGSDCYVVSVGTYTNEITKTVKAPLGKDGKDNGKTTLVQERVANSISKKQLEAGLISLIGEEEPTLLAIPEAVQLTKPDCFALQQAMLMHCGQQMKNRFAILDVHGGTNARSYDAQDVITQFREGIGGNNLNYGAAYYPWVNASIVQADEIDFTFFENKELLEKILIEEADLISDSPKKANELKEEIKKISDSSTKIAQLNQTLLTISPAYKNLHNSIRKQLNVMAPSAGAAGVMAMVDAQRGVWKAPANVGFAGVIEPSVKLTQEDQEDLNVTVTGKSVNALRTFIGEGTTVWGARTLDGNSRDWRYINVRRTLIFIEQSIKYAAKAYIYEPNTANTWILIRGMINSFLNDLWKQGGLVGLNPSDAYQVELGLGTTMTQEDVLDGIMKITIKVAISRPAEFIVLTFQQKMQEN
ncbi:phage tail sheath family protein [Persicobacter psychrovividus]|uniref:Tail sheath protein C-terminal domain-containing protein n=1 Tax=Persicobacter psychrovividus TaxID=387638 RepID=A0ABN6LDR1_9BACT|nr:hypothetical protein PEPS_36250 [Persicobacter psychrovividus]